MMRRLFIAIEAPTALKTELGYMLDQLQLVRGLKPVRRDQLHLTLAFLGDVDTARIPGIKKVMNQVASITRPFDLAAKSPSLFLDLADFRGIWVPIEITAELSNLANILRAKLANAGLRPDSKPFAAHITLARAKNRTNLEEIQDLLKELSATRLPNSTANEIVLVSSQLTPNGPIYTTEHKEILD